jgi:HEAT repeat protein
MKKLSEIVATYGSEHDHQDYWDDMAKKYQPEEIVRALSAGLYSNNLETIHNACVFAKDAIAHCGPPIMQPHIIERIEDIAAGENLKNAHTAVFVLGRIQSKKSVKRLQEILTEGKLRDPEFIRNLEVNIALLK